MKHLRSLPHIAYTIAILYSLCGLPSLNAKPLQPWAKFKLDGVRIGIGGSFKPASKIHSSPNGDLAQVASSVSWRPYREISIVAIPFGVKPGGEAVPVAGPGATGEYEEALQTFRESQGGIPQHAPIIKIFGQKAVGMSNLVSLKINGPTPKYVSITEWVVEAGERMWILRVGQEVKDQAAGEEAVDGLADLVLTTDDTLRRPSTLVDSPSLAETSRSVSDGGLEVQTESATGDLPFPSWWNGSDCDNSHYQAVSGLSSFRLGAVYRGMPACGPRPLGDSQKDVLTYFSSGSTPQLEWECAELAKRYLYLAYGVIAYKANGSEIVQNYTGSLLQKIYNGTYGSAPQAGDVLSYGSISSAGHTSVVVSSSVPSNGTCTSCIQVIEQNNSASGTAYLSINNWTVSGGPYPVSSWLHYPASSTPIPAMPASPNPGSTSSPGPLQASASVTLSWGSSSSATSYSLGVRDMTTNQLVVDTTTSSTSYTANLSPGKSYRWNVAACNSAGCSSYTTPLYFQTPSTIPAMPTNTSPGSLSSPGPLQSSTTVQLSWSAVSGATTYSFGVRDMITNQLVVDTTTSSSTYTVFLSPGKRYRWNVAACNANGCSSFTSPLYFQTP